MSDGELLCATGAALCGPLWMQALARLLDVNERTVRRWAADRMPVPRGVWERLHRLMQLRSAALLGELQSRSR
jgi:hypothetical protein